MENIENNYTETNTSNIPKEILDQYPYGQFPIRYTKLGQENIRRESENRFSYNATPPQTQQNNLNLLELIPLLQLMNGKKDSKEMFKILSKLLFKDNKDIEKIFNLISPTLTQSQELKPQSTFPDTNKIKINSLQRV